jgi:AcrR family transcriptional regulator
VDRELVLDAAERAIRRDGSGVSLETIAIEAGVTKPVVYARVGGRTSLADALSDRLTDRLVDRASIAIGSLPFGREMIASFIEANLTTMADNREVLLYVTGGTSEDTPQRTLALAERSITPTAEMLARWRRRQGLDPDVALPWAYGIVGMLHLVSLWWIKESDRSAEQMAEQLTELLWPGLSGL